jgi:hypothetical protein
MKHLKRYTEYITESTTDTESSVVMVVKAGDKLFHATGESFNHSNLKGGAYDSVIWTAKESGIAQAYIPVTGSSVYTSTENYVYPSPDPDTQSIQKQMGIEYDYTDIKFSHGKNVDGGYRIPAVFKPINNTYFEAKEAYYAAKEDAERLEKAFMENRGKETEERIKIREEWRTAIVKAEMMEAKLREANTEKAQCEYVNQKLREMGYIPTSESNYNGNHHWKLKTKRGVLLRADYRAKGRLFILTAKEDIRFFDYAGDREADLTNVDYHNIPMFRSAEKNGYDGIRITDFAQMESEGNLGHVSFGIFNGSIHKFDVEVLYDVEHPTEQEVERMYKTRNWHSREYLEHIKRGS